MATHSNILAWRIPWTGEACPWETLLGQFSPPFLPLPLPCLPLCPSSTLLAPKYLFTRCLNSDWQAQISLWPCGAHWLLAHSYWDVS